MEKDITIFQGLNDIPTHDKLVNVSEVLIGFFSRTWSDEKAENKLQMICRPRIGLMGKSVKVRTSIKIKQIDFPVASGENPKQLYE